MKKSKFTEEQIAFALKQAETGTPSIGRLCLRASAGGRYLTPRPAGTCAALVCGRESG